jgi:hypothetical protein
VYFILRLCPFFGGEPLISAGRCDRGSPCPFSYALDELV